MERIEKLKLAIDKGYTYNPITGEVISRFGNVIKGKSNKGYIFIQLRDDNKKSFLLAHQFAWYVTYGEIVNCLDHINGVKDDNRISNLRSVTYQQNQHNRTTAKGYSWYKRDNKWQAHIRLNGKLKNLGKFNTEEEARQAYLQAKEKYHII